MQPLYRNERNNNEKQQQVPRKAHSSDMESHTIEPILCSLSGMHFGSHVEALQAHISCLHEVHMKCTRELEETKKHIVDAATHFEQQINTIKSSKDNIITRKDTQNIEWDLDRNMETAKYMISDAYAILTPYHISEELYARPPFDYRTVFLSPDKHVNLTHLLTFPSAYGIPSVYSHAADTFQSIETVKEEILSLYNDLNIYLHKLSDTFKSPSMHYLTQVRNVVMSFPLG